MFRCSCCESRLGHSLDECGCARNDCSRCLLCQVHCDCTSEPEKVGFLKLVAAIAVSLTLGVGFGTTVAVNGGNPEWLGGVIGGVLGCLAALAAAGELDGFLNPRSSPNDTP